MEPEDFNPISSPQTTGSFSTPVNDTPAATPTTDCWNKVGVTGDGSCPELSRFVHCRNCPIYSIAGVRLLDRELPNEYRKNWTEHYSREKKQVTTGRISAVIFRIGVEWLALPTSIFHEIAERRSIHSLPNRRNATVLGLANVRGELLICVSIGRLLGLGRSQDSERIQAQHGRLVVASWSGKLLAFPVNEVSGIHRYHPEELQEPPSTVLKASPHFIRGVLVWRNKCVGCLDEELLFATLNRSLM